MMTPENKRLEDFLSETISPRTKDHTTSIAIVHVSAETYLRLSGQIHQNRAEYLAGYEEAMLLKAR